VRGFWHPVSAVYLERPKVLASPALLRLVLAGEGRAEVVYAGDRMWPAIRHGQTLVISPVEGALPLDGDVVLTVDTGIPDVMRMVGVSGALAVTADADPAPSRPVTSRDLLGRIDRAPRRRAFRASIVRTWLDLLEAAAADPDAVDDPAETVLQKYDDQAVDYGRLETAAIEPSLVARIRERVPHGARVLVAGSGSGREVFALEELGYVVSGVDFSPRMIEVARAEARRRGSSASFAAADLRSHDEAVASLDAVVFTYDVYSFVPELRDREALLTRVCRWLRPGGAVFLSARRAKRPWDRAVLSLQWLARAVRGRHGAWGDSHTRWLDATGRLRRSFVHIFTDGRLDRETAAAGLRRLSWEGGHGLYVPRHHSADAKPS
jgi:SAM-dependent methyltransferase